MCMNEQNKNIIISLILNGETLQMLKDLGVSLNDSSRSSVVRKAIKYMFDAQKGVQDTPGQIS